MTRFRKPCKDCEGMFTPTSKFTKYCEACNQKRRYKRFGGIYSLRIKKDGLKSL